MYIMVRATHGNQWDDRRGSRAITDEVNKVKLHECSAKPKRMLELHLAAVPCRDVVETL